jgi:O-antigen/teichoic acid export membrane protein
MKRNYDLDRKPTTKDRAIGIIGSVFLCAAGVFFFWGSLHASNAWAAVLISGGITLLSVFFLVRFIFTSGQKLGRKGVIAAASAITVFGFAMLAGSVLARNLHNRFAVAAVGLGGISTGILNFLKAKERL